MKKVLFAMILFYVGIANADTVSFLKKWEGRVVDKDGFHVVYVCAAGKRTIGYGETDPAIVNRERLTEKQAIALLKIRIRQVKSHILNSKNKIHVKMEIWNKMTENQKTALISLIYNMGKLEKCPKLVEKLNSGDFSGAVLEFADCNKGTVNGKKVVIKGLDNRRKAEMRLWNTK